MRAAPSQPRRRLALVGIDGFSPEWIERFLCEGALPHIASLQRRGVTVPLVSTLPATTPVAWASIATGCHPSATGIEGFLLHQPGRPLDQRVAGAYATRCRREPIWETATLSGRRAFVVKFPLSYPSTTATLRIDGAAGWGGVQCLHDAAAAGVADSRAPRPGEGRFVDEAGDGDAQTLWRGRLELPSLWGGTAVSLPVVATAAGELALEGEVRTTLRPGEWSDPIHVRAQGRRGVEPCAFRAKLLALTADGEHRQHIRLFTTAVHGCAGHSHPPELAALHLAAAGPIEEQTEPSLALDGAIDLASQLERCRLNAAWLERVSTSILTSERWDLFMVQIHIVDWAHHLLHGAVDPRHPLRDPDFADAAVALLREHYRIADGLVGAVAACLEPDDDLVALGDHGQDLHHTTVRLNEVLADAGLLAWAEPASASDAVDWSRTRAYAAGNYVYVNRRGRDPAGVVPDDAFAEVVAEIERRLDALVDPRTGERVVAVAGPKQRFADLGADGAGVGDVVLCLRSGFHARNDRGPRFELTRPLRDFTSGHDHFWPRDPRIETRLFAAGPSFAQGVAPRASVIDVAPTLWAALGLEPPFDGQGAVIRGALAVPVDADPMLATA